MHDEKEQPLKFSVTWSFHLLIVIRQDQDSPTYK